MNTHDIRSNTKEDNQPSTQKLGHHDTVRVTMVQRQASSHCHDQRELENSKRELRRTKEGDTCASTVNSKAHPQEMERTL